MNENEFECLVIEWPEGVGDAESEQKRAEERRAYVDDLKRQGWVMADETDTGAIAGTPGRIVMKRHVLPSILDS